MLDSGYFDVYESLTAAKAKLGGGPIMSKLKMITQIISVEVTKRRIILDCLTSGANGKATQRERVILPKIIDVVTDALNKLLICKDGQSGDAFFQVPLNPSERYCFVAKFKDELIVWRRVAQGSKNGPQEWGRVSALVGRLAQSLFSVDELDLQIYTDDPVATMVGTS